MRSDFSRADFRLADLTNAFFGAWTMLDGADVKSSAPTAAPSTPPPPPPPACIL